MSFKFLEHTSDIGVQVIANSYENAFEESVEALIYLVFGKKIDADNSQNLVSDEMRISGEDYHSLIVNYLNEILFLIDAEKIVPLQLKIVQFNSKFIHSRFKRFHFNLDELPINLYVKAVTFHQLKIVEEKEKVLIEYFVDV